MKFNLISVVTMGGDKGGVTVSSAGPFDDLEACEAAASELRKRLKSFHQMMSENSKPGQPIMYSMPSSYIESVQIFCAAASTDKSASEPK